jgi:hypothetical protein
LTAVFPDCPPDPNGIGPDDLRMGGSHPSLMFSVLEKPAFLTFLYAIVILYARCYGRDIPPLGTFHLSCFMECVSWLPSESISMTTWTISY